MTAVPSSEPLPAAPDGYPLTMTTLDGEVIEATAAEGQSVLDAAADAGHLLPALCRKGTCGACVATVVDGEFTLGDHSELALSPERAASGGALLCCTYPDSPLTISLPYERSRVLTGTISVCSATVAAIDRCTHDVVRLLLRLDVDAARASGIRVTLLKSQCFVIAAFVAGLAGSLYAHEVRYLAPNDFTFWKSIEILIMVVIGGMGSLPGAILGAAVVVGLPECLREIGDYRMLVFGAILMATMLFGEGGLAGLCASVGRHAGGLLMRAPPKHPRDDESVR